MNASGPSVELVAKVRYESVVRVWHEPTVSQIGTSLVRLFEAGNVPLLEIETDEGKYLRVQFIRQIALNRSGELVAAVVFTGRVASRVGEEKILFWWSSVEKELDLAEFSSFRSKRKILGITWS